jgi:nuclear transport factor 2 (NTF2) superfamily protein
MATLNDFEFIWQLYSSTLDPERRMFYLKVIGCIESEEILMDFIERMFERKNEWRDILKAAYSNNRIGLRVSLEFLSKNYNRVIGL